VILVGKRFEEALQLFGRVHFDVFLVGGGAGGERLSINAGPLEEPEQGDVLVVDGTVGVAVLTEGRVPAQDDLLGKLVGVVDAGDGQELLDGGAEQYRLAVLAAGGLALEKLLGLQSKRHARVFFRKRDAGFGGDLLGLQAPRQ
jgi:hypothetical protein